MQAAGRQGAFPAQRAGLVWVVPGPTGSLERLKGTWEKGRFFRFGPRKFSEHNCAACSQHRTRREMAGKKRSLSPTPPFSGHLHPGKKRQPPQPPFPLPFQVGLRACGRGGRAESWTCLSISSRSQSRPRRLLSHPQAWLSAPSRPASRSSSSRSAASGTCGGRGGPRMWDKSELLLDPLPPGGETRFGASRRPGRDPKKSSVFAPKHVQHRISPPLRVPPAQIPGARRTGVSCRWQDGTWVEAIPPAPARWPGCVPAAAGDE